MLTRRLWIGPLLAAVLVVAACAERGPDPAEEAARLAQEEALDRERGVRAAALERRRLADLWTYHTIPVEQGQQVTASIRSTNSVDTDGQGERSVQLVFRDHPAWGRSSYLVLQGGDFDCSPRCQISVTVDDQPPARMAARRPPTDEAIAMFINDWTGLWRMAEAATRLSLEFPVKAGGTRLATFDVAGLDPSRMPAW
jgi:hypothetical protein